MAERTYGDLRYDRKARAWKICGDPHVVSRLKRVFPRIRKYEFGMVSIAHSDEVARDLEWFMERYPLLVSKRDMEYLRSSSRRHRDEIASLDELVRGAAPARAFDLALPAREYQKLATDLYLRKGFLLVADEVGLGKTVVAIASFMEPRTLPAVVVTYAGWMPRQWKEQIAKFAPALNVHILRKKDPYPLPETNGYRPDVLVTTYHKLDTWQAVLSKYCRSIVFDEIQELRRDGSKKHDAAKEIARHAAYRCGLSATPIYNYGGEIYNVYDVLSEGVLGPREEFLREWCRDDGRHHVLSDPKAFGSWLAEQHLILRRTRSDVGRELPAVTRIPHTVDHDERPIERVEDRATELARIILDRDREELYRGEVLNASEQLSNTLRQATGIAKAKYVADFIRLLVESDEKVLVYAWHRAVYDILDARLRDLAPVYFTGAESPSQKEKSFSRFREGASSVLFMSLRAGAGLDGLQHVCRTIVFAELDWSWGVVEQCIGRVARDGQTDPVAAYFLVSDGGADPFIAERLGLKRAQVDGIRDPKGREAADGFLDSDADRTRDLARFYLSKIAKSRRKTLEKAPGAG